MPVGPVPCEMRCCVATGAASRGQLRVRPCRSGGDGGTADVPPEAVMGGPATHPPALTRPAEGSQQRPLPNRLLLEPARRPSVQQHGSS